MADTDCPWPRPGEKSKKPAAAGRNFRGSRDAVFVAVMALVTVALWFWPTGFEDRLPRDAAQVEAWRAALPERPAARRERLVGEYGLTPYDAGVLAADRPLARVGTPEDTARAVLYLVSDEAAWVTGTTLVVRLSDPVSVRVRAHR